MNWFCFGLWAFALCKDTFFFCILLAEVPQIYYIFVWCLRNFRKQHSVLHVICGTSARIMLVCKAFAELPQVICAFVLCLRSFRKRHSFLFIICGISANIARFCVLLAELPQMQCSLLSGSFRLILVCFWWGLMVFRVVIVAVERGRRNVGFLLLLPFSGWFSAGRNLFRALLLRWKCGVELAKSLHAGCRRACYSFLASMACVMSASNSSQSSGLSCSNVFVASRPCANLESL